jgi:hypothetical protein
MRTFIITLITLGFFASSGAALAGPPMKTLYSKSVSTNFKWHWPYQTVKTTNYVQNKPYFYTGRLLNLVTNEDVSKYRHYYRQNICKNDWGYFFPTGTRLCPKMILNFPQVRPTDMASRVIVPRF